MPAVFYALAMIASKRKDDQGKEMVLTCLTAAVHCQIWHHRNEFIFQKKQMDPVAASHQVLEVPRNRLSFLNSCSKTKLIGPITV